MGRKQHKWCGEQKLLSEKEAILKNPGPHAERHNEINDATRNSIDRCS